jgi:thiol peroxidase
MKFYKGYSMSGITVFNEPVSLNKETLKAGDIAPECSCLGVNNNLEEVKIGGKKDKIQVLISVPSLYTPVCSKETKHFDKILKGLDIEAYVISMDLPFSSVLIVNDQKISFVKVLSDFRNRNFLKSYGILIEDSKLQGLAARSVFIIDKQGIISYVQLTSEITNVPDYDEVVEAIKTLL